MKSERRHELKQNELKHGVVEFWHKIEPYWQTIAGVAVVLATALFAVTFVSANQRKSREAGWTDFFTASAARDADALLQVAQNHKDSEVAPWALLAGAQDRLTEASAEVHRDRELSRKAFLSAIDGFQEVLAQTTLPMLRQRALMGLGQAHEGINELSKAKEYYGQVKETWPDTAVAKRAQERLESLNDPATESFYKWFFAQKPPAAVAPAEVPNLPFEPPSSEQTFDVPSPPAGGVAPDLDDIQAPESSTDPSDTLDLLPLNAPAAPEDFDVDLPSATQNESSEDEQDSEADDQ